MGTGATVREAIISTAEPLGFSIKKGQLETIENFVVDKIYFQSCLLDLAISVFLEYTTKLCFQNSSHCSIIIVISPLIAIMKDQVVSIALTVCDYFEVTQLQYLSWMLV